RDVFDQDRCGHGRQEYSPRRLPGAAGNRRQRAQHAVFPGAVPGRLHPRAAAATQPTGAGALPERPEDRRHLHAVVGHRHAEGRESQQRSG
nr:hypothetical protein [Tanacetum cinerariifolium]